MENQKNLAENKLGVLKRKLVKLVMKIIPNYSTKSPIHLHLHELTHSEKRGHLFFDSKPLPIDVKGGLKDVGAYAKISGSREEIRTELRVKQMLEGLSDEGEKTLEYLS